MNVKRGWSGFPVRRAVSESLDLDLAFSLLLGHPDDSGCVLFCSFSLFIVCPIATAWDRLYTRFASVSVSVHLCAHLVAFLDLFYQNWCRRKNPKKWKRVRWKSTSLHPFSHFASKNPHFRPRSPENPCKYICFKCTRIAEIFAFWGIRGWETGWWRQILDRKWKYGRFVYAEWKMCNMCNITVI